MNALGTYLFQGKKQTREVGWFRNALYLFLLYKVFVYVNQFHALFSDERLIYHNAKHINIIVDMVFFLNNHYSVALASCFVITVALLALIGLFKRSCFISNILLWWLIINLTNFLYPTLTAGDFLLNQLLFFNCFFSLKQFNKLWINDLSSAMHNTALLATKLQICLAYFLSAYFKLTDDSWMSGDALYTIFSVPEYSNAFLASIPSSVCMLLTYFTIVYQLTFPFLVWFRPLKIWLFSFGIIQHLLIAFGMGLFGFGTLMIICYILFLKYDGSPADFADGRRNQEK